MIPVRMYESPKRGCPTCEGLHPKSCLRCGGHTRLSDWYQTDTGAGIWMDLTLEERQQIEAAIREQALARRKAKK